MYGKIFRQMYKGSMSRTGWQAIVTFQQFIVLADRHGEVDMTAEAIAAETTIPLDVLLSGIEILMAPDIGSRTPDEDGRRLVLLDDRRNWGWRIVNYEKYRKIQCEEDRREYQRQYYQKRKLNTSQQPSTDSIHADADAEAKGNQKKKLRTPSASLAPEFDQVRQSFPKRSGSQPWPRAIKAIRARLSEGSTWSELLDGVRRYAEFCASTGKAGTEYVMQAATFFGPDRRFLEPWALPPTRGQVKQDANVAASVAWLETRQ